MNKIQSIEWSRYNHFFVFIILTFLNLFFSILLIVHFSDNSKMWRMSWAHFGSIHFESAWTYVACKVFAMQWMSRSIKWKMFCSKWFVVLQRWFLQVSAISIQFKLNWIRVNILTLTTTTIHSIFFASQTLRNEMLCVWFRNSTDASCPSSPRKCLSSSVFCVCNLFASVEHRRRVLSYGRP